MVIFLSGSMCILLFGKVFPFSYLGLQLFQYFSKTFSALLPETTVVMLHLENDDVGFHAVISARKDTGMRRVTTGWVDFVNARDLQFGRVYILAISIGDGGVHVFGMFHAPNVA
jgi:hypothetical protein